jgi:hypothetical protein
VQSDASVDCVVKCHCQKDRFTWYSVVTKVIFNTCFGKIVS